jgi:hypothetical protein
MYKFFQNITFTKGFVNTYLIGDQRKSNLRNAIYLRWKSAYFFFIFAIFFCTSRPHDLHAQNNYQQYYAGINYADSLYFVNADYLNGLEAYKATLAKFEFVWIEDCIRFAQLALLNNQEAMAYYFLTKAIDNGLELKFLTFLNLGCSCNYYKDHKDSIQILSNFISKRNDDLTRYYKKVRAKYIGKLNPNLIKFVYKMHVEEQLYKVNFIGAETEKQREQIFEGILAADYKRVESLFNSGRYFGERNLGRYSKNVLRELGIAKYDLDTLSVYLCDELQIRKQLDTSQKISKVHLQEDSYFQETPHFINFILNNEKVSQLIDKHLPILLDSGYMHPREILHIRYKYDPQKTVCICPSQFTAVDADKINKVRSKYYLGTLQMDELKHKYAVANRIKLFFGHLTCSR